MKTIAQQLNVTDFPFHIKDEMGRLIYIENEDGHWIRWEFDGQGRQTYYENSSNYWERKEWDSEGREMYYENSYGQVIHNCPKPEPTEMKIEINGKQYKLVEI
jgi:hypothetical protein